MNPIKSILGPKVSGTRVVPIVTKIVTLFTVFLIVSNLASNYINITMSRGELTNLANRLLVKDLAELYSFASNEYEIFRFNGDEAEARKALGESAAVNLTGRHSAAFGITETGSFVFWASKDAAPASFGDGTALAAMRQSRMGKAAEGKLNFWLGNKSYFGVYKYSEKWGIFLVRAEETTEFEAGTWAIFFKVAIVILVMTALCVIVGALLVKRILRYVNRITQSLMSMQNDSQLTLIDLSDAPNDEVTYLGASFNALSTTIDNLMSIFRRFVTKDIAQRAYREKEIRLEGTTKELTILFSDIKGFTFMTETLGHDIIDVLNLHYQRAIGCIHEEDGIVGSIIGDALLAVFGTMSEGAVNKSLDSIRAAYRIQTVAAELRSSIAAEREKILARKGKLSEEEERVYRAVLVEVGVGIDGGEVFYGNIGSYERMTNTVIGDNVNSASRLEGLTRIYRLPVICSEYVKREVEGLSQDYRFVEIDTVQVKGKTEGKRIYWPARVKRIDEALDREIAAFSKGLAAYYAGDWKAAAEEWKSVSLPVAEVFRDRIAGGEAPRNWNGIWAMTTK
jgi:class 3 adenylate cyclase